MHCAFYFAASFLSCHAHKVCAMRSMRSEAEQSRHRRIHLNVAFAKNLYAMATADWLMMTYNKNSWSSSSPFRATLESSRAHQISMTLQIRSFRVIAMPWLNRMMSQSLFHGQMTVDISDVKADIYVSLTSTYDCHDLQAECTFTTYDQSSCVDRSICQNADAYPLQTQSRLDAQSTASNYCRYVPVLIWVLHMTVVCVSCCFYVPHEAEHMISWYINVLPSHKNREAKEACNHKLNLNRPWWIIQTL